ncbi:MAG TPA: hypothetical protein VD994_02485 [Prosthecobacter sp.]|nr:hypothetical protein [Prosthecobacter sp.]
MPDPRLLLLLPVLLCLPSCQTRMPTSGLQMAMKPLGPKLEVLQGTYRNIPVKKTGRDRTESDLWLLAGGDLKDLKHGNDTVTIEPLSPDRLQFTLRHHGAPAKSFTRRLARRGDWLDLGCRPVVESNIVLSTTGKECAVIGMTTAGKLCIAKRWKGWGWWFWMPIALDAGGGTVLAYYERGD